MKLKLVPYFDNGMEILSLLFIDRVFFAYTLHRSDHPYPPGVYQLKKYYSPKFQRNVLLITGFKDNPATITVNEGSYTGIEIHPGNTIKDTQGCLLIAFGVNTSEHPFLIKSGDKVKMLDDLVFPELEKGEVTLEVTGQLR